MESFDCRLSHKCRTNMCTMCVIQVFESRVVISAIFPHYSDQSILFLKNSRIRIHICAATSSDISPALIRCWASVSSRMTHLWHCRTVHHTTCQQSGHAASDPTWHSDLINLANWFSVASGHFTAVSSFCQEESGVVLLAARWKTAYLFTHGTACFMRQGIVEACRD